MEGTKHDEGKRRMDLLPSEWIEGLADVLTFGCKKYADRNWEKGMAWGRPFGALMRHAWTWWGGKEDDPETELDHMLHVAVNALFLYSYRKRQIGDDTRNITE